MKEMVFFGITADSPLHHLKLIMLLIMNIFRMKYHILCRNTSQLLLQLTSVKNTVVKIMNYLSHTTN